MTQSQANKPYIQNGQIGAPPPAPAAPLTDRM